MNPRGEVLFSDTPANKLYKIGTDEKITPFSINAHHVGGLTIDAKGDLFGLAESTGNLIAFKADGTGHVIANGLHGHGLVAMRNGDFYVTSPGPAGEEASKIWRVTPNGTGKVVDTGLKGATGVTVSADGWLLDVADGQSHWVFSYKINPDGTLADREPFHWLQTPDTADDSGADGLAVDQKGIVYAATRMGLQILDLQGHDRCMIASPGGSHHFARFWRTRLRRALRLLRRQDFFPQGQGPRRRTLPSAQHGNPGRRGPGTREDVSAACR